MKIGLMGGTFDPIHEGHLHIADAACTEFGLDEVWFLPAGDPYFKAGRDVTPAKQRLEMTRRCIKSYAPRYSCNEIEVERPGATYTSETLSELHKRYPMHDFYFIIGLDSLYQLHRWHEPQKLFQNAVLLCADRPAESDALDKTPPKTTEPFTQQTEAKDETKLPPDERIRVLQERFGPSCRIYRLKTPPMAISSSMIRSRVRDGKDISGLVTPPVAAFIKENGLYLPMKED